MIAPIVSIIIISLSSSKKKPPKESTTNALITWTPTLIQNMDGHDSSHWEMANWSNGDPFANTWQPDNITFNNGIMTINLDNKGCP
jgi:hypothetical protein